MGYIVAIKIITEAKHSIDGKRHVRTNYYCGDSLHGIDMMCFNIGKKKATVLSYIEAQKIAKRCGYPAEIIKV